MKLQKYVNKDRRMIDSTTKYLPIIIYKIPIISDNTWYFSKIC